MKKLIHILESQQFSKKWIEKEFLPLALDMEKIVKTGDAELLSKHSLSGKKMARLFWEPSTGTAFSFDMAMDRLGGKILASDHAGDTSKVKGEALKDSMRRICGFNWADVIVLRTPEEGMAKTAAEYSSVPVINAGDGWGQHPSQALTDVFTVKKEKGTIGGLHYVITGDLRGRTVNSLVYLIAKFPNIRITFVAPLGARIGQGIKDYLNKHLVPFQEVDNIMEVVAEGDVFYITRIQKERDGLANFITRHTPNAFWGVDKQVLRKMKKDAIVMHPLPHEDEIAPELDPKICKDRRIAYFRQSDNKQYVAMALLKMILK